MMYVASIPLCRQRYRYQILYMVHGNLDQVLRSTTTFWSELSMMIMMIMMIEEQTLFDMLANKAVQETCSKDLDIIACVFNHPKVQDQLVNNHSFR